MSYNTKQKDIIVDLIKKQRQEFTIKDIHEKIKDTVGLTTIYRVVDCMIKDKTITKYISEDKVTYYQYLEKCDHENHFYLKCEKCGSLIHIDCECIGELTNHILVNHEFMINREHIIINGICKKCRGGVLC